MFNVVSHAIVPYGVLWNYNFTGFCCLAAANVHQVVLPPILPAFLLVTHDHMQCAWKRRHRQSQQGDTAVWRLTEWTPRNSPAAVTNMDRQRKAVIATGCDTVAIHNNRTILLHGVLQSQNSEESLNPDSPTAVTSMDRRRKAVMVAVRFALAWSSFRMSRQISCTHGSL